MYTMASGRLGFATGIDPLGLAEDNDDNFVLAASTADRPPAAIPTSKPTPSTPEPLTSVITSTTGTDPVGAIAIARNRR